MNPLHEIARLLLNTGVDLYIFVLWMRFLLQALGADFYNPVSQFVVHATSRLVDPLDRMFQRKQPPAGVIRMRRSAASRWSIGALVLIVLLKLLQITAVSLMAYGQQPPAVLLGFVALLNFPFGGDAITALSGLLPLLLKFYLWMIIGGAILSWVAPQSPAVHLVFQVTEPVLAPCRRLLPNMGGFDLSPIIAILGIQVLEILLKYSAQQVAMLLGV